MITVSLALAMICFNAQCHPILVGQDTIPGIYQLHHLRTDAKGYGGDILAYKESTTEVYAIHRVWLQIPSQHRAERIRSLNVQDRYITAGCINVEPAVYDELVNCCSNDHLSITN